MDDMNTRERRPPLANEAPTQSNKGMIDLESLMRIKSMELRARVVMEGFMKGIHRSPFHGFSVEFTEYREYTIGDDPRYLDWKLLARSDRSYIKKYEDETNLRCHLLVDHSRSMGYQSIDYNKAEYAATLAATLASFLFAQGDAVGMLTFDEKIDQALPPRNRPGHLRRIMLALENTPQGEATDLAKPLQTVAEMLNKRSLLVLISDLLAPIEMLQSRLGWLRTRGHDVVVFNVFDPAELSFNFEKPILFKDIETGEEMFIEPNEARSEYQDKLNSHIESIQATCNGLGVDYHQFATDRPFDLALLDFLNDRLHHAKQSRNQNRSGGGRV